MPVKPFAAASVKTNPLDLPTGKPDTKAPPKPAAPKKPAPPATTKATITRAGGMARVRVGQ